MDGSQDSTLPRISLARSARRWWNDAAAREGRGATARRLLSVLAEFVRDSTPERRRRRYGDAEYDWDHRVNTTSAAVGWRDRLLGLFHSPYQPTESVLFHEMIEAFGEHTGIDLSEFVFVDLGSGKPEQRRFGGGIGGAPRQRDMAHDGAHVQNAAVSGTLHSRNEGAAHQKCGNQT